MLTKRSHPLPAYPSSFVGRARERAGLAEQVRRSRLTTVVGPGGAGKTRLAVETAAGLGPLAGYVELGPADDPTTTVMAACGIRADPHRPAAERLLASLRPVRGLLVVDGAEHRRQEVAALVGLLLRGCSDLRVLGMSRVRLGVDGEVVVPLGPLDEDDGVELFLDRARAVRPDLVAERETVRVVCRLADGLPLAVELVAGHARALPLGDVLGGMADRLRFVATDDPARPARHRSLRACIAWGEALLGGTAVRALAALSVVDGRFTLAAATAAAGVAADTVEELVEHSLVAFDPADGRYRLLDTVREHAGSASDEVDAAHGRLRTWVAGLARELAVGLARADPAALTRLDRESAAVASVLREAAARGRGLQEAADIVVDLAFGWSLRGLCPEGRDLARGVADAFEEVPPRLGWALAFLTAYAGDLATGVGLALEVADRADPGTRGRALTLVGMAQLFTDPLGATEVLAEAVALGVDAGDGWGEVEARQLLAYCHLQRCADAEALRCADAALPALDRLGHAQLRAWDAAIRAEVSLRTGRLADAESVGRAGLRLALGVAEPVSAAACMLPVVRSLSVQGRPDDGAALVDEVRPFFVEHPGVGTGLVVQLATAIAGAWSDPPLAVPADLRAEATAAGLPALAAEAALLDATVALHVGADVGLSARDAEACAAVIGHRELVGAAQLVGAVAGDRPRRAYAALTTAAAAGCEIVVPDGLDVLAHLALDARRVTVAATLHAAADRRREELGLARSPLARAFDADRAAVSAALPKSSRAECIARGWRLDRDRAVAWATRARGPRDRPSNGWESLTPTEREVAALVGKGLTNAAIGAALLVSPGTVRTHLRSVFGKLAMTSRAELAALVARRGA